MLAHCFYFIVCACAHADNKVSVITVFHYYIAAGDDLCLCFLMYQCSIIQHMGYSGEQSRKDKKQLIPVQEKHG